MSYMQDIPVRNHDLLTRLNRYRDFLMDDVDYFQRLFHLSCQEHASNRHYWTGQDELDKVVREGVEHEGFPDSMYGYELSTHRKNHEFFSKMAGPMERKDKTAELGFMNHDLIQ